MHLMMVSSHPRSLDVLWSEAFSLPGFSSPSKPGNTNMFLKWCILVCCRWHGLAANCRSSMLWFFYRGFPKLHILSFHSTDTFSNLDSAGSYGPRRQSDCTAVWTCCRCFPTVSHTQSWEPSSLPGEWVRAIFPTVENAAPEPRDT